MKTISRLVAGLLAAAVVPTLLAAQEPARVTGRVTNTQGQPEAGVQVEISALNVSSVTGPEGTYTLVVPGPRVRAGQPVQITARRQGLGTSARAATLAPGTSVTVDFVLATEALQLEGLVVTALGITREERAVSTSVSTVGGDEISQARETNVVNSLAGKVPGVVVTNAGPQGGSARIVIRGANSLTGDNQPLFVVDGIPIDNSSSRQFFRGFGGLDYGNAAQDINPNDIENVSVLRGPNAAALYGSRAANGVILITTKTGRNAAGQGLGITVSQNTSFETPLRLPRYQNVYGQGSDGEFEWVDGNYGSATDGIDESWGPKMDGRMMRQFWTNGAEAPWVPAPDNVRDFFETGITSTTNVAVTSASDRAHVRISGTYMDQDGMYPGFRMQRGNVGLNGGMQISSRWTAQATAQYINADARNRPGTGYDGDNPMLQFVWFGRQVDTRLLRDRRRNEDGTMFNWNYSYHSNPYWIALENRNWDSRDRIIGSVSSTFEFTPWLSATLRTGTDWYENRRKRTFAGGSIGIAPGPNGEDVGQNGTYDEFVIFNQEASTEFLLQGNRRFGELSFDATVSANRRDVRYNDNYAFVQELTAPGIYNLRNAAVTPFARDWTERQRVNSILGQATFGFRDFLFVDVTGRNDWSSTLPEDNRSYFYPSVSGSLVFTDAVPALDLGGALSFGKVRASWTRVGNSAAPFQIRNVYEADLPFVGRPTFHVSNIIRNADLRPEATTSVELGSDLRFLHDRLELSGTYYRRKTTDQILPVGISPTTGFSSRFLNAGSVSNRGVELQAVVVPVRLDNGFQWELTGNYARNRNQVDELYGDLQGLTLGGYWSLTVQARAGEPYGVLWGNPYLRDDAGNLLLTEAGQPQRDPQQRALGNYNPDWVGSLNNRLSWRNLDLSFLLDTKQGGEFFSMTHTFGQYAGVLEETLFGREVEWDNPGVCVNGLLPNGTRNEGPGCERLSSEAYFASLWRIHEAHILDASFVKLREMRLGYNLPESVNRRLGVTRANVSVVGRNLALWTENPHLDPETAFDASNVQGLEFGQLPSARSIGFNIVVTP